MTGWASAWVTWLGHEKDLQLSTRKLYARTIELLEREFAPRPIEGLKTKDLVTWLQRQGGSASSYGNRVAALRSFYGYLKEERGFKQDPSRELVVPKRPPRQPDLIRNLEAKLRLLDELDRRVGRRVGESRDMAVLLAETGMRVSDACALSLKPPVPETIRIPRRRGSDGIIQLTNKARNALDRLDGRFGIGPRALQRRFEKADFHPDQLRHWYRVNVEESDLRDAGVEVRFAVDDSLRSDGERSESDELVTTRVDRPQIDHNQPGAHDRVAQTGFGPEQQFWMELAGQLEGIIELIRKRFAA